MDLRGFYKIFICIVLILGSATSEVLMGQCSPNAIEIPNNGIDEDCDNLDDIFLHMPSHIYMVEGKDFEFYFRNVILSTHPEDYVFEVSTALSGTNTGDKWTFMPTFASVGDHPFTVTVRAPNGQLLASASSIVRIAPANSPSDLPEQKIIMMGHSFINQGYTPYYFNLLTEEPGNPDITLFGKQFNWVDGVSSHEAVGGASWKFFKNDVSSPIRYFGQMNFPAYFNDVLGLGERPDILVLHLDVNDYNFTGSLTGNTIEEIEDYIEDDYAQHIEPIITALRAAAPNTKIAICYTPPCNSRQGAFTGHFGAQSILADRYRWKKITNTIYFKYDEYFRGRESENIYMLPIHLDVDDVNEFDIQDPVHPWKIGQTLAEPSGYQEIAKSKYAWVKYMLNQGANGQCLLNNSVTNLQCDNNGTEIDATDDTYTFDLSVNGVNADTGWTAIVNGQNQSGTYGMLRNLGPYVIADGQLTFGLQDQGDANCQTVVTVIPPTTCSNGSGSTIDLELSMESVPAAPLIYTDFSVNITVSNTDPLAASDIKVRIPKPASANYQAGNAFQSTQGDFRWYSDFIWDVGSLPPLGSATLTVNYFLLTGSPMTMYAEVTDASPSDSDSTPDNGNSTAAIEDDEAVLTINGTVTNPCTLSASASNVQCNDNGTDMNPDDDTYSFSLVVNGANAGANGWTTTINGQSQTGQYGVAKPLGPYSIAEGNLSFMIQDAQDSNCSTNQVVTAPQTCSNNNGGTGTDLSLEITGSQSSVPIYSNFSTTVTLRNTSSVAASDIVVQLANPNGATLRGGDEGGTNTGTFEWWNNKWVVGNLAAGQSAILDINYFTLSADPMVFYAEVSSASPIDSDSAPNNGTPPNANEDDEASFNLNGISTGGCTISAAIGNVSCNDNGTSNTDTDDTYTFDLTASGATNGSWTTQINGQTYTGTNGQTRSVGPLQIANEAVSFTIEDQADATCSTNETVDAPATCSSPSTANCASVSAYPWHDWISKVQIGTYTNNSSKSTYSDNTADVINVQRNQDQSFLCSATYSFLTYDEYWKIWIDYNQNNIFEEPNELVFSGVMTAPADGANVVEDISGTFTVPNSALLGNTRMRVSMKRDAYASPCETLPFGEVEDYTVNITDNNPIVSGTNTQSDLLYFTANERKGGVALDWAAQAGVSKFDIQWSTNGLDFSTIQSIEKPDYDAVQQYDFLDTRATVGMNYYRIESTNRNGIRTRSAVEKIELHSKMALQFFPNPAQQELTFALSDFYKKNIAIQINNALGTLMYTQSVNDVTSDFLTINTSDFPSGIYTIQVRVEGHRMHSARLVVQQ